jgi:hypothetical protein
MAVRKLFSNGPVGAVAIVETPVSQWYAKKARIAFLVLGAGVAVMTAAALSVSTSMPEAILIGLLAGFVGGFVAGVLVRAWPVIRMLWWWSIEITAFGLAIAAFRWIAQLNRPWVALVLVLTIAAVCGLVGPVRRWLVAWYWCVVVRHRLRLCFASLVRGTAGTRPGLLPLVLWARPTPAGERVWLWLRPGLEVADLDGKAGRIAVTCWASEVRVVRASQRYAALIRVDIARRDPLANRVESPLAALVPRPRTSDVPVSPAVPTVGLDLADIPDPPAPDTRGGRR